MNNYRLVEKDIPAFTEIAKAEDFPIAVDLNAISCLFTGKDPVEAGSQIYGYYHEDRLIAIMTASYFICFPHHEAPNGKMVHITGAYVLPEYRRKKYGTRLLKAIEDDAREYFHADYLCCDTIKPPFFDRCGFICTTDDERRMWKSLI